MTAGSMVAGGWRLWQIGYAAGAATDAFLPNEADRIGGTLYFQIRARVVRGPNLAGRVILPAAIDSDWVQPARWRRALPRMPFLKIKKHLRPEALPGRKRR